MTEDDILDDLFHGCAFAAYDLGTRDFDRKDSLLGRCVRGLRRLTG